MDEGWRDDLVRASVKKFKDRATAVNRIWKAIQGLGGTIQTETTNEPEIRPVIETAREPEIAAARIPFQLSRPNRSYRYAIERS
jgi:hypothetical protein